MNRSLEWLKRGICDAWLSCDGVKSAEPKSPSTPEHNPGSERVCHLFCSYLPRFRPWENVADQCIGGNVSSYHSCSRGFCVSRDIGPHDSR